MWGYKTFTPSRTASWPFSMWPVTLLTELPQISGTMTGSLCTDYTIHHLTYSYIFKAQRVWNTTKCNASVHNVRLHVSCASRFIHHTVLYHSDHNARMLLLVTGVLMVPAQLRHLLPATHSWALSGLQPHPHQSAAPGPCRRQPVFGWSEVISAEVLPASVIWLMCQIAISNLGLQFSQITPRLIILPQNKMEFITHKKKLLFCKKRQNIWNSACWSVCP